MCLSATSAFAETPTMRAGAATGFRLLHLEKTLARWPSEPDKPVVITYAFVDEDVNFPSARNCTGMHSLDGIAARNGLTKSDLEREIAAAARQWEVVANIRFERARDAASAKLLIGAQNAPMGRAFTNVELTAKITGRPRSIAHALICLNPQQPWKIGFDGNLESYDLRYTLTHEIGHAIGLDHPGAAGQLMGYRYTEAFSGLQPGDIAGAIALYGGPPTRGHATATDARSNQAEANSAATTPTNKRPRQLALRESAHNK